VNKVVRNERKKLTATWFNTFATAIMTAGVLAPFASIIYGFAPKEHDPALMFAIVIVCMLVSAGLHLSGRAILRDLEEWRLSRYWLFRRRL
jgi:O-antigen/teichoic acid export membrane protein